MTLSVDKKELLMISKPLRYIGGELNSVVKNNYKIRFCLSFPDVYEVGMSHYGFKLLYEKLNECSQIACERFFMPWIDAIDYFGKDIFVSLETNTPLKEFDLIGFSLQYELSYTNLLYIIKMSDIPLLSTERKDSDPIIIAGGPCVVNPAPLIDFVDVFFIGEMEEDLVNVLEVFSNNANVSRKEKLEFFNKFHFTYVPQVEKDKKVRRKIFVDFPLEGFCKKPIVPNFSVVQDRVSLEISRGCTRGCRFCQAGFIYRPVRERGIVSLIENALTQIENTGYFELSFLSLSAADFCNLEQLLVETNKCLSDKSISISLPSVRADQIKSFIFRELSKVRKSGFTIAPEAGSQRLRNSINKNLTEEEIIEAVELANKGGFNHAKLYFMIGLPFETDEDVLAIATLAEKIKGKVDRKFEITVSVSNFVPKPFTPYQWLGQDHVYSLKKKQDLLRKEMRKRKIKLKLHDVGQSILEACFSRGGVELGKVLYDAVNERLIFDGWSEFFNFDKWKNIFEKNGQDIYEYASKGYSLYEDLPWDNIDVGLEKKYLMNELEKAKNSLVTEDCRFDKCTGCGVCDFKNIKNIFAKKEAVTIKSKKETNIKTYIVRFEKKGDAIFYSALDTSRYFQHIFIIHNIELQFSRGFNPQPKINYIYPLPLGISGENEIMVVECSEFLDTERIVNELNEKFRSGFKIKSITEYNGENFDNCIQVFKFDDATEEIFSSMLIEGKNYYEKISKKGKKKIVCIDNYLIHKDKNRIELKITPMGGFNLLEFFKFWDYNISKLNISRTNIYPIK
ncbi:TIGR03960 family B12-binding radical SAM protein [Deferribacter autotrophicus]|uniref:TIGR03960 family B12-binding radical SAM protein n=1 Tax=Deferribacter autotrophicus TaxID=500465 RepID=A0A5A8F239_9BACT|nr:TIGR03960 family B12-binding radical SAM protein [Deferribacter autotrophicus]KAA0257385.1 TIGR03960 family B12-binding radical SAM protein [Deferribacter autotrophicus]